MIILSITEPILTFVSMKGCGVYTITCTVSGEVYVGSTTRLFCKRWGDHRVQLRKGTHANIHLQRAWNKYGEDYFLFEVLVTCDKNSVLETEQFYMDNLDTYKRGFNRCPSARNSLGLKRSEKTLEKMRKTTNYQKANAAWSGSKHTEETRRVIKEKRAAQIMLPWSEERLKRHKEMMSIVNKRLHTGQARNSKYFNVVAENAAEKLVFMNTRDAKAHFNLKNVNGITKVLRREAESYIGYRWYVESPSKIE